MGENLDSVSWTVCPLQDGAGHQSTDDFRQLILALRASVSLLVTSNPVFFKILKKILFTLEGGVAAKGKGERVSGGLPAECRLHPAPSEGLDLMTLSS